MEDVFGVAKISNIFLGVLKIPDIFFGVNGRCWARAYVWRKNKNTPFGVTATNQSSSFIGNSFLFPNFESKIYKSGNVILGDTYWTFRYWHRFKEDILLVVQMKKNNTFIKNSTHILE